MRPRIGVLITAVSRSISTDPSFVFEGGRYAEELGYDTIWMGETWGRDAVSVLSGVACNTSSIRLGTAVMSVFSRSPTLLAQTAATLDEISGGRFLLGLGASSETLTERWHGVPFEKPLARTREYIDIIRQVLSGNRLDYEGEFYKVKGLALAFEPVRQDVPIYLGSLGPKNVELTGEMADGWVPAYLFPAYMPVFRQQLASGASRSGRSAADVELAPWILTCASVDGEEARQICRDYLGFFVAAYGRFYYDLVVRYGFVEEANRIRDLWQEDRSSVGNGVSAEMLEALSVSGTPDQVRQGYAKLLESGIDVPSILLPPATPQNVAKETVETLAPSSWEV